MATRSPAIVEKVLKVMEGKKNMIFRRRDIIELVLKMYPETNPTSVIPSDYCYNLTNAGIPFKDHLFKYIERNKYKYLGPNVRYEGTITHNGKVVGCWKDGKPVFITNSE